MKRSRSRSAIVVFVCIVSGGLVAAQALNTMSANKAQPEGQSQLADASPSERAAAAQSVVRLIDDYKRGDFQHGITIRNSPLDRPLALSGPRLEKEIEAHYPILLAATSVRFVYAFVDKQHDIILETHLQGDALPPTSALFVEAQSGTAYDPVLIAGFEPYRFPLDSSPKWIKDEVARSVAGGRRRLIANSRPSMAGAVNRER
jgi:hypothetical protein